MNFRKKDNYPDTWGMVDAKNRVVTINLDVLKSEMTKGGFDFSEVINTWVDRGYVIKDSQGEFIYHLTLDGINAEYIKLRIPEGDKLIKKFAQGG